MNDHEIYVRDNRFVYKIALDLSSYLASFCWGTGRKYGSGRNRLIWMLTIYFLCDIKNNLDVVRKLFIYYGNGKVYLEGCCLPLDLYEIDGDFIFDKREIIEEIGGDFLTPYEKLKFMRCREKCDSITEHDKKLLEKIFRKFGAYDTKSMYEAGFKELFEIVPFKLSYDHGVPYHVDLDVDEFMRFLENNKFKYQDNEILNFIKEHYGIISEKQVQLQREKNELKRDFQETAERTLNSHNNEKVTELVNMVQEIEKMANLENMTLDEVIDLYKDKEIEKSGSKKKVKRKKFW